MVAGTPSPSLIDRERELEALRSLVSTGKPRLALLTGRRRIGKTYLLTHAFPSERAFHFTAARTSPELNRRQLLLDLARWSGEPIEPEDHPTWRSVFNLLMDVCAPDELVVIVDEFQYLADDRTGLAEVASELNAAWERRRPPRPFLLVLAGSAVSTMEALASGGAPLYGRFHWHHRLAPFDYLHAGELAPFRDLRDRARAYGIFGGIPRYLAATDASLTLRENAIKLMLSPGGEVRQLVETALDQEEGLRDVQKYKAILRAVASGQTRRNEIAQRSGLGNDTALRDKLERLVELGYLEERRNIDAKANEPVRYEVADSAVRFHQRFVEPNLSMLARSDPERVWDEAIASELPTYMGHAFEPMAGQAYERLRERASLPLVREWGRWEGADRDGRSLEIDIVATLAKGPMLTGAVKWNADPVGVELHFSHLEMLMRAGHAGRKWAHDALDPASPLLYVAAGGFAPEFVDVASHSGHVVVAWDLKDLYGSAA